MTGEERQRLRPGANAGAETLSGWQSRDSTTRDVASATTHLAPIPPRAQRRGERRPPGVDFALAPDLLNRRNTLGR